MQKTGRNEPCPCGSSKKYKACCWQNEFAPVPETKPHDGAVRRAIAWLEQRHRKAFGAAVDELLTSVCTDRAAFARLDAETLDGIQTNVIEWLLAEGELRIAGETRKIPELLLAHGGPLFTVGQRAWIQQLSEQPLRLYAITGVVPGAQITLCDALDHDRAPIVVRERSGTHGLEVGTLVAYRIMNVDDHHELSGAAYPFSQFAGVKLTDALRQSGIDGRRILFEWVQQFLTPTPLPELRDAHTGEPIRLITDHYKVLDWEGLAAALAGFPEIEGDSQDGWTWLVACDDGQRRSRAAISRGKTSDRIEAFYQTQGKADEGRSRLEALFGTSARYLTREITEPRPQAKPRQRSAAPAIPSGMDPETFAAVIEQAIRRAYANWADEPIPALDNKTPRETIKTPSGLERVKGLIRSYEAGEERQAREQGRAEVSFQFLWDAIGIAP